MTLEDLKVYVAVCEAENLSAVARQLGCTQPAVSQHVSRLERELGVALLERRNKGVAVTEAGRVLYEGALEGLDAISVAVRQIEALREGETGSLGISTGGTTVKHFFQDVVVGFRKRYPEVSLRFHSANSMRRCVEALRNEQADLAFITISDPIRGIEQRPAVEVPWVLVVREDDKLARRKHLSLKALKNIRAIRLPATSASQVQLEALLAEEGVRLSSSMRVDDWDTALMLTALGLGHAITPAVHASRFAEGSAVRAIPIRGLPPVTFGWAARRWRFLSAVALDFVELFAASMRRGQSIPGLKVLSSEE